VTFTWLRTAAAATLLVTLLLLLPTAYYYGSRRAIVLAGVLALGAMLVDSFRRAVARPSRLVPTLALVFTAIALASFYPVRQLGPDTAGAAAWALDAAVYTHSTWVALVVSKLVLAMVIFVPRLSARPLDTAVAFALLFLCLLLEFGGVRLPRMAYAVLFAALLAGASSARHLAPSSLFAGSLLLLEHLYGGDTAHLAPIQTLLAATAAALLAWRRMSLPLFASRLATGLSVAVGLYLMFWPTVGFHLVGIDFAYMFQWVRVEDYEQSWWVIGLGIVVKLALPLVLVVAIAREELRDPVKARVVTLTLGAKAVTLSLMISSYAVQHDMSSQQALAMLAELLLLMFGVCASVAAIPLREARTSLRLDALHTWSNRPDVSKPVARFTAST
jgi:hypothetical protein